MFLNQIFEGLRDPKDNPCWKGYHPVGTKKKDGRTVPNCVPNANESVENPYGYEVGQTVKLDNGQQGRVIDIFDDSIEVLLVGGKTVTVDFRDAQVISEESLEEGFFGDMFGGTTKTKPGQLKTYAVYDGFTVYYDSDKEIFVTAGTGEYKDKFRARGFPALSAMGGVSTAIAYGEKMTGGKRKQPISMDRSVMGGAHESVDEGSSNINPNGWYIVMRGDLDQQGYYHGDEFDGPYELNRAKEVLHKTHSYDTNWTIVQGKFFKNKEDVTEVSLGDYRRKAGMQKAQAGMGAMFAFDPEQRAKELATFKKRERGLERVKARDERDRKAEQQKQLADLIARLPELKAEYADMRLRYKALGGSDWQYADREQNLTDREREARSMEGPMNNLWRQIQAAEKAQGLLEAIAAAPGAAPAAPTAPTAPAQPSVAQQADQKQQALLDRMGARFGLPPGSSMEQVQAAQQAYLNKNDPAAAAQYKQNMANIDAGNTAANKPVQLAPKPAPAAAPAAPATPQQPAAAPVQDKNFAAGLAAQKAGGSPTEIMLAQPDIANNQQYLDAIAPTLGLPAGSTVEQLRAAAAKRAAGTQPVNAEQKAIDDMAKKQGLPAGLTKEQFYKAYQEKLNKQKAAQMPKPQTPPGAFGQFGKPPAAPTQAPAAAPAPAAPVAEGEPGDLEHELNRREYHHDKIAGRYDPDEFDQMVTRLGQRAKEQERKNGPVDLAKLAQRLRDIK